MSKFYPAGHFAPCRLYQVHTYHHAQGVGKETYKTFTFVSEPSLFPSAFASVSDFNDPHVKFTRVKC